MNRPQHATSLTISGMGSNGDGYAIVDGQKVFIPFTVTGDQITAVYDHKLRKTIYNVEKPSKHRITPICQHFEYCGGCTLQHLSSTTYAQFKIDQITAPLLAHHVELPNIAEPYILGPYQRRRVTLKAERIGQHIHSGYHQFHTHNIVNIIECPVTLPSITQLFDPLRTILKILLLKPKTTAEIAIIDTDSGLDVMITVTAKNILDLNCREQLINFARQHRLARLSINKEIIVAFHPVNVNFADIPVGIDAGSFLQTSRVIDRHLEQLIDQHFKDKSYKRVADLFCGRGTLSLPLSKYSIVDAYEIDTAAIHALRKAVAHNNIGRLHIHDRNLFDLPLSALELGAYECVVLNPPRAGAYAQIKQLAQAHVPNILYLSCNPQTFARDAAVLTAEGYQFDSLIPIDQFHWSHHIEIIATFSI